MTALRGVVGRDYVLVGEQPPILNKIDWRDVPIPFKLYRGCRSVAPTGELGHMLRDIYGITRQRWTAPDSFTRIMGLASTVLGARFTSSLLRSVPSGGALYPSELYVVVGARQSVPSGVYHYDASHHMLDVLAAGYPQKELAVALGQAAPDRPALVLLLTTYFWKNAFKYGEFSYRLGCLDVGVLISQVLEVARNHGLDAHVHYQFLDQQLDDLLGLDYRQESVYAVVSLGASTPGSEPSDLIGNDRAPSAHAPSVPASWSVESMELSGKLHDASRLIHPESLVSRNSPPAIASVLPATIQSLPLAEGTVDLADGIPRRRSAMGNFSPTLLTWQQLSSMVHAAVRGYSSDLAENSVAVRHTALFCAVVDVHDVERGIYYCDPEHGTLKQVSRGDIRMDLQHTLVLNIFNLAGSGVCFVPAGNYDSGFDACGDRWYRIQNMEAGVMVQRLHLAAAALGLGCRVNCGYSTDRINRLLGLDELPVTGLAQVLVGAEVDPGHCYDAVLPADVEPQPR